MFWQYVSGGAGASLWSHKTFYSEAVLPWFKNLRCNWNQYCLHSYSHTSADGLNVLCTNRTSSVSGKYSIMYLTQTDQFRNAVSTRLSATRKHIVTDSKVTRIYVVEFVKESLLKSTLLRYLTVFWLDDTKLDNETCGDYSSRVWHE